MKQYPSLPRLADAPDELLASGHLWLLEKVDGAHLRFQLRDSGLVRFGDRTRVYDDPGDVPEEYQYAVRHVREHLDREALRAAVDDVADVVFFGEAMHRRGIDYDWDRTSSFLGFDVWSADAGRFRPPDAVEQIFESLGLTPVNAVERERRVRDFDPDSYEIPRSAWYDGPAEGVVVRDKQGRRGALVHPDFRDADDPDPIEGDPEEVAAGFATEQRLEELAADLESEGWSVTVETLYERVLENILREEYARFDHPQTDVDMAAFRSEVAALVRGFVDERTD